MGNICVHVVSNCVDSKSSSWVRPTDLIMDTPVKPQLQNKPPQQMVMLKEEKTQFDSSRDSPDYREILEKEEEKAETIQKQHITDSKAKTQESQDDGEKIRTKSTDHKQVLGIIRPKPAVMSGNIKKPHNVKRLLSAGLQAESVLKTKTGHLKESYNLGKKLGHGQFGTTFLCVEKETGKEYACKSIAKRNLENEEDVDDVRREIEIMQHLSGQPNVISIKGAYEDSVAVHMVMELCKGGELFDRIVERGYYAEKKAARLAKVIIGVVLTCHSLGVMHRDLKPENFLFVDDQEDSPLKAIDFGFSVFFKPGDTFNDVVGSPYYVAPEVLNRNYGPEADIWSAGVMIYVLLCGSAPFWGETEEEIFDEVLHGNLDLSSDPWPQVSESAKDLIRKMLERNPRKRLTAHQVLSHPWIRDEEATPNKPLDKAVMNHHLKKFSATNKLKKMALIVIAQSLSEEEIGELKETFEMIDRDNSGQVTYEELKDGFERLGASLNESEIQAFMQAADVDNNGKIGYREFIAATLNLNRLDGGVEEEEEEDRIRAAFMYFDKDGSGYITQDEVRQACHEFGVIDVRPEELISEVDQNNDGCIDYSEFMAMLYNENKQVNTNSKGRREFKVEVAETNSLSVC